MRQRKKGNDRDKERTANAEISSPDAEGRQKKRKEFDSRAFTQRDALGT